MRSWLPVSDTGLLTMQPLPSPTVPSWGERLGSQNRAGYTPGPMGPKRTREAETDSTEGPGSEVDRRGLQWYHSLRVPRLPLPACAGRKWGPLGARAWGGGVIFPLSTESILCRPSPYPRVRPGGCGKGNMATGEKWLQVLPCPLA